MTKDSQAARALLPMYFILGEWEGEGSSFGQSLYGKLHAYLRFQDSFLCIEEQLFLPCGSLDYEDMSICSWSSIQNSIVTTNLSAPAQVHQKLVICSPETSSFRWWSAPNASVVYFSLTEAKLLEVVVELPDTEQPASKMLYRRMQ